MFLFCSKVALEAMGEDECVVPMDPEEAVRMISGLGGY
jgi:hypothetical protein